MSAEKIITVTMFCRMLAGVLHGVTFRRSMESVVPLAALLGIRPMENVAELYIWLANVCAYEVKLRT